MKARHLIPVLLLVVGCGPQGQDLNLLVQRESEWLDMETFQPYTGQVFRRYADGCVGDLALTGYLLNGQFEGEVNRYFCDREPYEIRTYRGGRRYGLYIEYGFDGTIWTRGNYDGADRCGEWMWSKEYRRYPPCPPDLADGN